MKTNVYAAFPSDMNKKPVICHSMTSENVAVYKDEMRSETVANIDGDGLVLTATSISRSGQTLYGSYKNDNTGDSGEGWIATGNFVVDPDYVSKYATVRAPMTIYKNSNLSATKDNIKKYSGIIVVSKRDDALQVIYEKKGGYGIGWLDRSDYKNTLDYDGRDKQTLANGNYKLIPWQCEEGTEAKTVNLVYDFKGNYFLEDPETGKYLTIKKEAYDPNDMYVEKEKTLNFFQIIRKFIDPGYRKRLEDQEKRRQEKIEARDALLDQLDQDILYEDEEKKMLYSAQWVDAVDEDGVALSGTWTVTRKGNAFTVCYAGSDFYLGMNKDSWILLKQDNLSDLCYYKVRATTKTLDSKKPFVLTQYDAKWCGSAYGSEGCIGTAGCGLLATMNAVYSLSGQYMDVFELADYAVRKGYRIIDNGTSEGIFKAAALTFGDKYGVVWDGSDDKISVLKEKLKAGDTAVCHVIGHYVAIVDYNEKKNKFLLLDSNHLPKRKTTAFGDWISQSRLEEGYLFGQNYYFFKLAE